MIADEKSETEEREKGGGGERDEEEVGAREKSDAVKHSAVRVIRLRKSAWVSLYVTTFYRVTILPIPSYIFMREHDRKPLTLVSRLARKNFRESRVWVNATWKLKN